MQVRVTREHVHDVRLPDEEVLIVADRRVEADQIAADLGLMAWEWAFAKPRWLDNGPVYKNRLVVARDWIPLGPHVELVLV